MKAPVPDGHDKVVVIDGEGACQVNRVRSPQGMAASQLACALFDVSCQLYLSRGCPEFLPGPLRVPQVVVPQFVVPCRSRERGTNLRISEPTGERAVARIPEFGDERASRLFNHQLYQST